MIKNLLNKARSLESTNKNTSLRVQMSNDVKVVEPESYNDKISAYAVYMDERYACNKLRLTAQINLMASNVLFNHVTEIVKNEDSDDCVCLNFTPTALTANYGKDNDYKWGENISDCVRDTQITSPYGDDRNYVYHSGIDIFNNHILRSKNSPSTRYSSSDVSIDEAFNTIHDFIRDMNGRKKMSIAYSKHGFVSKTYLHLYQKNDIYTFSEALNYRLNDKNGWLGFLNKGKMPVFDKDGNDLEISRVINNEQVNKFIYMYPGKDCYDLLPYYNKSRHRREKNWEYCLTYPYSSTTENIPCINSVLNTLKVAFIDESEDDYNGILKTTIYSSCKHGLTEDDTVNIYRSSEDNTRSELIEENVIVDTVIDEYTFSVYLSEYICKNWVSAFDDNQIKKYFPRYDKVENNYYRTSSSTIDTSSVTLRQIEPAIHAFNNQINADFDTDTSIGSQNISFTKTINNNECHYYVRIFSRLPNFEFMEDDINEETIYDTYKETDVKAVDEFAKEEYGHASILSKLSFAKNIYNDNMNQIVFTDDICIDYLHDNLGRPLSSIYLSFFKTNYGRKEWYNGKVGDENVEHSHCFGKLNCGLELSPYISQNIFFSGNTRLMNNVYAGFEGLPQTSLRPNTSDLESDEISYIDSDLFYGDLCEYSSTNCLETVLQPIMHRFNTQQRELEGTTLSMRDKFDSVEYDEITYDDFDFESDYLIDKYIFDNQPTAKCEGYTYQSNHEIPIRVWSGQIRSFTPTNYELSKITYTNGYYHIITVENNNLNQDSNLELYNKINHQSYYVIIKNVLSSTEILVSFKDKDNNTVKIEEDDIIDLSHWTLYIVPNSIPTYAKIADDTSATYKWRYLYQNGFEESDGMIEEYPFTNGRLYVNSLVNLYLRRQDPFNENGLFKSNNDLIGNISSLSGVKVATQTDSTALNETDSTC